MRRSRFVSGENMNDIEPTRAVSHCERPRPVNALLPLNMLRMLVALVTSQLPMSGLHVAMYGRESRAKPRRSPCGEKRRRKS